MYRILLAALLAALTVPVRAEIPEIRIARQFSMGYLQFNVMEHEKLVQKHAAAMGIPEVKVTGFKFNGPASMNDALLSGSVDIVSGSPQGVLTIWARTRGSAQEVRAIGAMATAPFAMVSNDDTIKTIADVARCGKIAVPAVKVSAQAVSLQLAAANAFGLKEYTRYDGLTVSMAPPDSTVALLSGTGGVNCVWAVPPYLQQLQQNPGIHTVLNSFNVWGGPSTYTTAYASSRFRERNPVLFKAFYAALEEATARVNADLTQAAKYWIEDGESKLTPDFVRSIASAPGTEWTMVPRNTVKAAKFMYDVGSIKTMPESWKDFFFPEAHGLDGS
jgi:NitT/TauT family transport system substrate-binding protein